MSWLRATNLSAPHCFFDRHGGVSTGLYTSLNCGPGSKDNPASVHKNRQVTAHAIAGNKQTPVVTGYQIHSAEVHSVDEDWGDNRPKGDGFVTDKRGLIIGVLTADCAPVLFHDPKANVVGVAHAGWRGAVAGVTDKVIALMEEKGASRSHIQVAIGPTIGVRSYEVGPDMRSAAMNADPKAEDWFKTGSKQERWQFNLIGYPKNRLECSDVTSLWTADVDTYDSEDHFSFRRTTHERKADYGRQLSAIMLV